jgi:hypothetical protein
MKASLMIFAAAAYLSTIATSSAFAQRVEVRPADPPVTQRVETRVTESPGTTAFRAKDVLGGQVSIAGNVSIGKVDDIVFDPDGYIEFLIIENQGKLVTVPWEAAKFNFKERTAMINITAEQFRTVPTYTVERYPEFTAPTYRADTYRYYGLTPRERRIERRIDRRN